MKRKFLKFFCSFNMIVLILLVGCGKDGDIGPKGDSGPKGEQGIPGANGSTILSGKSVPQTSIGKTGDFYVNLTNGDLYGPKKSDGWGTPFSLKGPQGDPGKDGSVILSGNGVPSISLGKVGDFYFDKKEISIYGPKSATTWGNPVSLKSDEELGVIAYVINPVLNVGFKTELIDDPNAPAGGMKYKASARSQTFTVPDGKHRSNEFYYLKFSRYDLDPSPGPSSTKWVAFYNKFYLENLSFSIHDMYETFEINIIDERFSNATGELTFRLECNTVSIFPFLEEKIEMPDIKIMLKSAKIERIVQLSKKHSDVFRYLRIKQ